MLYNYPIPLKFIHPIGFCGYVPDHEYMVTISEHEDRGYVLESDTDLTDNRSIDVYIRLSSKDSIRNYFKEVKT